jgi:DNA-binding LytR/AlgR family response regulator
MADINVVVCVTFDHRADPAGLERFKKCICQCAFVEVTMEVSGPFDLIVQGKIATLADYTEEMARIRPQLAEFVTRIEANFVGKKFERKDEPERFMWVPFASGLKQVDVGTIDKVIAEGDYMRLYIQDWHCLIHSTVGALKERLDGRFIQLHRSSIVRIDFIDRLMHQDRRWIARLRDGSQQAVAKSHVPAVLDLISVGSSKHGHEEAKTDAFVEKPEGSNEIGMQPTL